MALDTNALINDARCVANCIPTGMQVAVLISLAAQIIANGGTGGGGTSQGQQTGLGSPVGVKTPEFIGQLYTNQSETGLWQSTGLTNADWTALII